MPLFQRFKFGIIFEFRFAQNLVFSNIGVVPEAGVVRFVSVVSHTEIQVFRNGVFAACADIAVFINELRIPNAHTVFSVAENTVRCDRFAFFRNIERTVITDRITVRNETLVGFVGVSVLIGDKGGAVPAG